MQQPQEPLNFTYIAPVSTYVVEKTTSPIPADQTFNMPSASNNETITIERVITKKEPSISSIMTDDYSDSDDEPLIPQKKNKKELFK